MSLGSLPVKRVVVVGGGSAGWLTAGIIAADHSLNSESRIEVVLVESPELAIIGVGEGTWPTMQRTLNRLRIREGDFIRQCDVSFKQGTKFVNWVTGNGDDRYDHPFTLPADYLRTNLAASWQTQKNDMRFADAVCVQSHLCDQGLAPKQYLTPEYAYVANYGYHLNAERFAKFLRRHCTEVLNVKHHLDHVTEVNTDSDGYILSVNCRRQGEISGDLFIDCTGVRSLLLGKHYDIPFVSCKDTLFIDSALAAQIPYADSDSPIASQTISTAQSAGWIWDIGLPSRRGIGHVYCGDHISDDEAERELRAYIKGSTGHDSTHELRKISFNPGHRKKFWHKNCVAVGMAAGFLEPLEASALVMVELSAAMISEYLPANRELMPLVAKRFNKQFLYHWDRIIDFLKLHYVLSQRSDTDFWIDNRHQTTIPDTLQELLALWKHQFPWHGDFTQINEIFSAASYQYILYGMGFETAPGYTKPCHATNKAEQLFAENAAKAKKLLTTLPKNRELINHILADES